MMEMRAIVIQLHGDEASVKPMGTGGCGHCDSEGGCGSGTLTKLFCSNKARNFKVRNDGRAPRLATRFKYRYRTVRYCAVR